MNKPTGPKWYEEEMEKPATKADKMMHMKKFAEEKMEGPDMMGMEKMPTPHEHPVPVHMTLAHAYVPWQCYNRAFSPCEALMHGTLFPELFGVYHIPE